MRTSDTTKAIGEALVAFQAEIKNPGKDSTGQVGSRRYKYASLPEIVDHIRPVMAKHGLAVFQSLETHDGWVGCTTLILHKSGEWVESGLVTVPLGGKEDAQAAGSAATYSRRYSLAAALNLAPDEDDDAQSISGGKPKEGAEFTPHVCEGYYYGVFQSPADEARRKEVVKELQEVRKTHKWTDPKNKIEYDVTDAELDRIGKAMARYWKVSK